MIGTFTCNSAVIERNEAINEEAGLERLNPFFIRTFNFGAEAERTFLYVFAI